MNPILTHVILISPVFVAPVYWLVTRKQTGPQAKIRVALWIIFGLHILLALPILIRLPELLRTDVGRFDDFMYGLLAIGILSAMASSVTILLGQTLVFLYRSNKGKK